MLRIKDMWSKLVGQKTKGPVFALVATRGDQEGLTLADGLIAAVARDQRFVDCDEAASRCDVLLGVSGLIAEDLKDTLRQQMIDYKFKGLTP